VEATDAERRRIERDLHDGTQQRLVSIAMSLGLAESKLPGALGELCCRSAITTHLRVFLEGRLPARSRPRLATSSARHSPTQPSTPVPAWSAS